jgi:glycosyltransferase involved in cell wall biosynthesis
MVSPRRTPPDLVGGFDEAFSPGYGEEVDFCQRAVAHGFRHVCADDVFTFHRGSGSFSREVAVLRQEAHEEIVRKRYPWYEQWARKAAEDPCSNLALALATARRSLLGLRLGVDARCLGPHRMGTQQVVVETIRALARRSEVGEVVAFTPRQLPSYAADLRDLDKVTVVEASDPDSHGGPLLDLVYRPYQVNDDDQLDLLDRVADGFVVNQLDTIAFENPAYFADQSRWFAYRDLNRLTFERAAGIAFLSEHSRRSARAAGLLVNDAPTRVVYCGVDTPPDPPGRLAPPGLSAADDGFLLCLGASYLHKNRRLALDLWAELRRRGSSRRIVLAGPAPPHGNSRAAEAELLLTHPELRADVVEVGAASEAEKQWLYAHAGVVLYLSTSEGFGLVPFEAAALGVPTLATRQGSLDEVLPEGIPTLDGFDFVGGADLVEKLVGDEWAGAQLCEAIVEAGASFTWDRTAAELLALFGEAMRRPRRRTLAIESETGRVVGQTGWAAAAPEELVDEGAAGDLERMVSYVIDRPWLPTGPGASRRRDW